MKQSIIFLLLFTFCCSQLQAQEELLRDEEITIGLNLNTNGGLVGGGTLRYSKLTSKDLLQGFSLEIVNVKHKKEERFSSAITGRTFIRGKRNYLLSIRPLYIRERILFEKYPEEGVRLSSVLGVGPTFGLIKPYFVEYRANSDDLNVSMVAYDPDIHEDGKIAGGAGFFSGFDESTLQMGINFRAGLNFEFGRFDNILAGIESGLTVEAFPRRIPLFSSTDNPMVFSAFYLNLYYGSRY